MGWGSMLGTGAVGIMLVVAIISMPATAASNTDVILEPGSDSVDINQTATFDVVVTNASRGVGAVTANISVTDGDVASAAGVVYEGNPSFTSNRAAGDEIRFAATGMDTADNGSVTIGSVQFTGESAGSTTITMRLGDLSDEPGESYQVHETEGAQLSVGDTIGSSGGSGGTVGGGDSGGNGGASDRWMDDGGTETADNGTDTTETEGDENETTTETTGTEGGLEGDTSGPPDTESPDDGAGGFAVWQIVVFAGILLLAVGGLIYGIWST